MQLRLRVLALAVLCLVACKKDPATGKEPVGSGSPVAKDDRLERPFLWSAKKGGNTTYLFGTMHMGVDPDRLPPLVWKKLDEARSFAMESNPTDPALARLGQRTSPGSLDGELGAERFAKLERILGKDHAAAIRGDLPVRAAILLGVRELPETPSIDHALWQRARRDRKRVTYLEEAARQVAMLTRLFDIRMLAYMIDDADANAKAQRALLSAYLAGDPEQMLAAGTAERAAALAHGFTATEYDAMTDELLYARNRAWISGIEELHADGVAFVAVGAMHLVGPGSVLDLLQKRGYDVARVLN